MNKISADVEAIKLGQAVLCQKLDDFMTTQKINHEEQRAYCAAHNAWTASLQKKVENLPEQEPFKTTITQTTAHEALKNRVVGAARVLAWVGGSSTFIGAIIAKVLHHKGGTP